MLVCLIFRGVAFEYRGKRDSARWRLGWDCAIFGGSLLPAVLWGVAFGNVLHGIPLDAAHNYTGNFFSLLNPYSLLGGVTTLSLFTLNGALFLGLKTTDDLRRRANALAWKIGLVAIVAGAALPGVDRGQLPQPGPRGHRGGLSGCSPRWPRSR